MITKQTCYHIWNCHNEIDKANEILKAMAEKLAKDETKKAPELDDGFGRSRGLQLGVPYSDSGHTLYDVGIEMGVKVIEQHIKDKQARLAELMAIAKIELSA
jgi:hypothetical protein